jgi:hypothetical protein
MVCPGIHIFVSISACSGLCIGILEGLSVICMICCLRLVMLVLCLICILCCYVYSAAVCWHDVDLHMFVNVM